MTRRRRAAAALVALAAGCGGGTAPPDLGPVPLGEGSADAVAYRLVGRRAGGELCATLEVDDGRPAEERCGFPLREDRTWAPGAAVVADRQLLFGPVPAGAVRVRLDVEPDAAVVVLPTAAAAGFPGRFFLHALEPGQHASSARAFREGGREVKG